MAKQSPKRWGKIALKWILRTLLELANNLGSLGG
jgi:hypothetical protein